MESTHDTDTHTHHCTRTHTHARTHACTHQTIAHTHTYMHTHAHTHMTHTTARIRIQCNEEKRLEGAQLYRWTNLVYKGR